MKIKVTNEQISHFESKLSTINEFIFKNYQEYILNEKIEYIDYVKKILNKKIKTSDESVLMEIENPDPIFNNLSLKEFLVPCFEGMIVKLVHKYVKNKNEFDDAKQHAICSLCQFIYFWKINISKLSTFVHKSLENSIISYIKSSRKHSKTILSQEDSLFEFYSIEPRKENGNDINYYIKKARLNSDEIDFIKFAMENDSGWQTKMAEIKGITRQAISFKFKQICKKIVESANDEIERKFIKQ